MTIPLPGPRGHWLLGCLPEIRRDILGFFDRTKQEFGDVAYFRLGNRRSMLLSHPADIEQVLVTENRHFIKNFAVSFFLQPLLGNGLLLNEGQSWLQQRRLIQPAFSRQRVEGYASSMVDMTERMLGSWTEGQHRDIGMDMLQLTMAIAGKTLLDVDVGGRYIEVAQLLEQVMYGFLERIGSPVPVPFWIPTPAHRRLKRAINKLDTILLEMIDERRRSGIDRGDFLSLLINARDEDDGSAMSNAQLRDEVMTMFLAGHETTANALTWTCYLLGQDPAIQQQLHDEAADLLGGRRPTAADVAHLPLCERIVREGMRLYPPAFVVGRRPVEDITIAGHRMPQGTNVLMSQWVVQRDERWFTRPSEFDPTRWEGDWQSRIPKYAYFPFGGGPRVCIGNAFAMQEAVILLAMIFERFELKAITQPPVPMQPAVTLRPAQPILMEVRRRPNVAA
jgi:cytochrome P450